MVWKRNTTTTTGKIQEIVAKANTILYSCSTMFPFTFFPDRIEISLSRVSVIRGLFFLSKHTFPILIEDLVNVKVTTGLIFGTVQFEIFNYESNPKPIRFLHKADAIRVKQYVTGLIEAKAKGVDLSKMSVNQLREKLTELGSVNTVSQYQMM